MGLCLAESDQARPRTDLPACYSRWGVAVEALAPNLEAPSFEVFTHNQYEEVIGW
jgi:hypothetical protein